MAGLASVWDDYLAGRRTPPSTAEAGVRVAARILAEASDSQVRAHVEYQGRPFDWIVEMLGIPAETIKWSLAGDEYLTHKWDGTRDPIVAILEALANWEDVGVESATGTGKTFIGACIVLWFLACFEDSIVVTVAPKSEQLELHIWKEIGRIWPRFQRLFPQAQLLNLKIRMRAARGEEETWAATGFGCGVSAGEESATKAQGFHGKHMLIVFEETPGIPKSVMQAFFQTCTDDHNLRLAFGNPDSQHDALHEHCKSQGVRHVIISGLDHPNYVTGRTVVPGAVGRRSVLKRLQRLMPGATNPFTCENRLFKSRIRGISPAEASDALIKTGWCRVSSLRYDDPVLRGGLPALGIDVANSEDGDKAAIARGLGCRLLEVDTFQCPDTLKLGIQVAGEMEAVGILDEHVGVDAVGVGSGTVNKLRELGRWVHALQGGPVDFNEARADGEEVEVYNTLRSQMWWQMAIDLQFGRVVIPDDRELWEDLTAPTWEPKNGKIVVQSKEEIKKVLGRSPDKGDAAVYWNWVRYRPPAERSALPAPTHRERVQEHVRQRLGAAFARVARANATDVEELIEGGESLEYSEIGMDEGAAAADLW